jgi:hypothetical protein
MLRRRHIGIVFTFLVLALAGASVQYAGAQIAVSDPWVTAKDEVIAVLKNQLLNVLTNERDTVSQMAGRLSRFTNLGKYAVADPPVWRIHLFLREQFVYANPYNASLNYGDGSGAGYEAIALARQQPGSELAELAEAAPHAYANVMASLATLDVADSTIIAGTDQTGQLRFNGRAEQAAIDALEMNVVDPSLGQSATAVLDKISGATLLGARQQQARLQFLAAMVEQLLVDNKRDRDTEAAIMNMQLGRLKDGAAANATFIAGAGDDLRTWRQP